MSHIEENLVVGTASGDRRCVEFKGGLGAKQPASKNNSSEERADFFTDPISGSMLASPKKSNIKKYTKQIIKTNKQAQPDTTNPILTTTTLLLLLLIPTACKTTHKNQDQINRVLLKQGQLLQNLKQHRTQEKLHAKIEQDVTLKDSETRLLKAIEVLIQSNRKLRQTFSKKEKSSE